MCPSHRSVPQTNKDVKGTRKSPATGSVPTQLGFWPADQESDRFSEHLPLSLQSNDVAEPLELMQLRRVVKGLTAARTQLGNLSRTDVARLHRLGVVEECLNFLARLEGSLQHVAGAAAAGSRSSSRARQKIAKRGGLE